MQAPVSLFFIYAILFYIFVFTFSLTISFLFQFAAVQIFFEFWCLYFCCCLHITHLKEAHYQGKERNQQNHIINCKVSYIFPYFLIYR